MKKLLLIVTAIVSGGTGTFAFDAAFKQGQTAYDEGRYGDAIRSYESMLSNGVVNAEIHYNLANALFKSGSLPPAVRHYRIAWYSAPRDPDIAANLRFALNAAGAVEPRTSIMERFFTTLSIQEWGAVAVASYLLLCTFLLVALLLPSAKRPIMKLSLVTAVAMCIALWGWWQWRNFRIHPEAVVVNDGVTALFGPVAGATAHYKLPAGALVRVRNTDPKGWVEVEYDGKDGWIKKVDILRLSP